MLNTKTLLNFIESSLELVSRMKVKELYNIIRYICVETPFWKDKKTLKLNNSLKI